MSEPTKPPTFIERVAASAPTITPIKAILTLLALPFYAVGLIVGLLFVAGAFIVGAVKVGIADVRKRADLKRGS